MNKSIRLACHIIMYLSVFPASCRQKPLPNQEMIDLLKEAEKYNNNPANVFAPEAIVRIKKPLIYIRICSPGCLRGYLISGYL